MIKITGSAASDGVAIGKIYIYKNNSENPQKHNSTPDEELMSFEAAYARCAAKLAKITKEAHTKLGEEQASIFEIHEMMLADEDYVSAIKEKIAEGISASEAVQKTSDEFAQMFKNSGDEYMCARAIDVQDISNSLIDSINNRRSPFFDITEPVIIVAEDLSPSETISIDKSKLLGFVSYKGSKNSHTSILARTMAIAAVTGISSQVDDCFNGKEAILDGTNGLLIIEPTKSILDEYIQKQEQLRCENEELARFNGKKALTKSSRCIAVNANVGGNDDIRPALENGADGVGLYRSEFIYLQSRDYPTVNEQFEVYKKATLAFGEKEVTIRTLDIGADKQIAYFKLPKEENPAMGIRGIRLCFERMAVFKDQIKAILMASNYGNVQMMFPMVANLWEIKKAKAVVFEVMKELENNDIAFDKNIKIGIMIETPAAVILSDELAKEVDFFSIGTNDLTQYIFAADRQNSEAYKYIDEDNTALLRFIDIVVKNAHKEGIKVSICGELGSKQELIPKFVEMGIDKLSVSPAAVNKVKQAICGCE